MRKCDFSLFQFLACQIAAFFEAISGPKLKNAGFSDNARVGRHLNLLEMVVRRERDGER